MAIDLGQLIHTYGYLGMFAISFVESGVFFMLPGDYPARDARRPELRRERADERKLQARTRGLLRVKRRARPS